MKNMRLPTLTAWLWSRGLRGRGAVGRALRAMLCALVLLGLMPGSHELVENLAHLLHDGHLAHSEIHQLVADSEHCEPDAEHGCTPLDHHCGCCVSLIGLPDLPDPLVLPLLGPPDSSRHPHVLARPPLRSLDPPYRPPIDTQS